VFGYIVQYGLDPWDGVVFKFKPKQLSASQLVLGVLAMFLQADIINSDIPPHGAGAQSATSLLLGFGAADFIQYILGFVVRRFSQNNVVYYGTRLPQNSDVYLMGGDDSCYLPMDAVGFPLPSQIVEDMARVVMFELPMNNSAKVVEIRLPILCGFGGKLFNANPLDTTVPSMSVNSLLELMYPNATFTPYVFGAAYSSKYPLSMNFTTYSKFFGSTPAAVRRQVGSMMSFSSQNFPTSAALANVEEMDETLLYYTAVAEPYDGPPTTYDYACLLNVHSLVNKYAFDPRHALNDTRSMPLAICQRQLMSLYTLSFDETKSMDFDTTVGVMTMLQEVNVTNRYSGYPSEGAKYTETCITQCRGGGFLLKLGHIAGRLFKAAPSIFEAISGAFAGQNDAPAKQEFMNKVVRHAIRISQRNPYNPLLRVVPNSHLPDHSSGHRLRV